MLVDGYRGLSSVRKTRKGDYVIRVEFYLTSKGSAEFVLDKLLRSRNELLPRKEEKPTLWQRLKRFFS